MLHVLHTHKSHVLQPVPETMRLEMLVEMQIEILDGQSSGLFSNGPCSGLFSNDPCEKRPVMTIEDFDFHFDDRFESHLLRNRLCTHISHMCDTHMCH